MVKNLTIVRRNLGIPFIKLLQQTLKGATAPPGVTAANGELTCPEVPTFSSKLSQPGQLL